MARMYNDGLVTCTARELVIRRYYFPLASAKRIPYERIRGLQQVPLSRLGGRWRIWGSGDFVHYFNLDPGRVDKSVAFVLDLGARVKPVITPDEPDRLVAALAEHRIEVTRG
ncbi:hypothetical protein HS99_0019620 [Kitasatospora aureofaciens]|uniref:Bacterial Pleckstrin homology domain-containing protein n=1 Tax=Kitasatospora aureofaciens TaxID=1894 RepID=A0A1E7NE04_KITAU|nr:hypothetical protein HS99_0019620 [Kitasatospora aureofaciens]